MEMYEIDDMPQQIYEDDGQREAETTVKKIETVEMVGGRCD